MKYHILVILTHYRRKFPCTHPWPFSKSKFNLNSDRVNLVAPASPIECLRYLPNVREIQYKLGPERLTRLGNSNVLRLPVRDMVCLIHNFNAPQYSVCIVPSWIRYPILYNRITWNYVYTLQTLYNQYLTKLIILEEINFKFNYSDHEVCGLYRVSQKIYEVRDDMYRGMVRNLFMGA